MLKLLDNTEKIIKEIETLEDPCWHEKLNGLNVLEFTTLDRDIKNKDRVVFQDELGVWHEFIVESIDDTHEDVFVYCEDSFYETRGDYIDDRRFVNANFSTVADAVMSYTRWNCKVLGDLGKGTVNFYRTDVKSAVFEDMQSKFDFEIKTYVEIANSRISQRVIELRKQRGHDNGKRFTYDKDITSISRTIDSTEFCTALYAYGKGEETENGGYGRRIDLSQVNNGKKYVENNTAKEQFGKYVNGKREHIFATCIFGDIDDRKKLLKQAKKKLKELSEFKVTYKCDVLVLNKLLEDRQHEGIELGDTVAIIDKDINIRVRARVVERKSYLNSTKADEIVLGNFIEDYATQQAKIKSDLKSISNTINEQGQAITDLKNFDYYASIVKELNDRINATGGYVYISKDGQGLITYDKPVGKNPTKAIQLKGGAIRIANSKKSDGTWNWTTFGTGDGFTADKIIAGILQGGKVRWNLEDGTFLIGNSISDYSFYWDGSTLHMKDVDIDLTNNSVVKNMNQNIDKNNEDIKKANDVITQTQTSVQILKDSISSKVSKTEILSDKEIQNALKGRDGADGADGSNFTWNLLRKSNISVTNAGYPLIGYKLSEKPKVGETYTCTIWGKLGDGKRGFRTFNSGGYVPLGGYSKKIKEGLYQITFNWENDKYGHVADDTELMIYPFDSSAKVESTINKIKLEKGINTNPVWSPCVDEINGKDGTFTGKIGGRNLIKNSDKITGWTKYDGGNHLITDEYMEEFNIQGYRIKSDAGNGTDFIKTYVNFDVDDLVAGKNYTFSVYVKNNRDVTAGLRVNGFNWDFSYSLNANECKRFVVTGKRDSMEGYWKNRIQFQLRGADKAQFVDMTVARPQLEEGDVATSWSKNPNDFDTRLNEIVTSVATKGEVQEYQKADLKALISRLENEKSALEKSKIEAGDGVSTEWDEYVKSSKNLINYINSITSTQGDTVINSKTFEGLYKSYEVKKLSLGNVLNTIINAKINSLSERMTSAEQSITDDKIINIIKQSTVYQKILDNEHNSNLSKDELMKYIEEKTSILETNIDGFSSELTELYKLNDNDIKNIQRYFRYENGIVKLGDSLSSMRMELKKNRLSFFDGSNELAYFSDNSLFVENVNTSSIDLKYHRISSDITGITAFVWKG